MVWRDCIDRLRRLSRSPPAPPVEQSFADDIIVVWPERKMTRREYRRMLGATTGEDWECEPILRRAAERVLPHFPGGTFTVERTDALDTPLIGLRGVDADGKAYQKECRVDGLSVPNAYDHVLDWLIKNKFSDYSRPKGGLPLGNGAC